MYVRGTGNTCSTDAAAHKWDVNGTLALDLKADRTWEKSTLEVTTGEVDFEATSTFTLYGWHRNSISGTHCVYDTLTVDNGEVVVFSGAILNPFWAGKDSGDGWGLGATMSGAITDTSSSIVSVGFGAQQNIPSGAGSGHSWSQRCNEPTAHTIDVIWT
jgi:hypothetical protein